MSSTIAFVVRPRHVLTAMALAACQVASAANGECDVAVGTTRALLPSENVPQLYVCGTLLNEVTAGAGAVTTNGLFVFGPPRGGSGVVINRLGAYLPFTRYGFHNLGGTVKNQTGATMDLLAISTGYESALENDQGGSFFNQSGGRLNTVGPMNNLGGSSFVNESTNSLIQLRSAPVTNGQIVNKGAGTLFDNRDGAAIQLIDSSIINNNTGATFRNRNQATVSAYDASQVVNSSAFENSSGARVLLSGGTLFNTAGGSFNNLSGAGITTEAGGRLVNQGIGSVLSNTGGATITLKAGGGDLSNRDGGQLTNSGTGTRITIFNGALQNQQAGTVHNLAGAVVDLFSGTLVNSAGATWINDGLGTHLDVGWQGALVDTGTFTNQNKAFVGISGDSTIGPTGQFHNTSGGTVSLALSPDSTANTGNIYSRGLVTNVDAGTSLSVNANTFFRSVGASAQVYNNLGAQMTVSGSNARIDNTETSALTNNGNGTVLAVSLGGTLNNNAYATLNNIGGAQLSVFSATLNNTDNGRVINDGAGTKLSVSFGALNNAASLTNRNAALIDIGSGSTFTNSAGGTLSNASGATLKLGGSLASDGLITNGAIVTMAGGSQVSGTGTFVQNDAVAVTDVNGNWTQGVTQVLAGTFRGTGVIGGAVDNRAVITAQGSGLTFTGAVSGNGSFTGTTRFNGSLDPGGTSNGLGTLRVATAVLGSSNRLTIEIGGRTQGSGYDALLGGTITLGGTLAVQLVPAGLFGLPLALQAGDSFDVLSGSLLSGDFSSFELPALAGGLAWGHQTVTTSVLFGTTQAYRLTVSAVPEPGSWALMLAGLAATGSMVRRRQSYL